MPDQANTGNSADIIRLEGITKRFGGVTALNNVSLSIRSGEVHAIVGENGAGKSTLMKLLAGVEQPDEGTITIDGKQVNLATPRIAEELGIAMVYQELSLFLPMTVSSNIFVGREMVENGFLKDREMRARTADALKRLRVEIDPRAKVDSLSQGQRQIVEIARAVSRGTHIVIMDEPNSALNQHETKALFEIINTLKESGITVLYVSHRLEEVFAISDRISVLRDGHYMGTWSTPDTTIEEVVTNVVGRQLGEVFPERKPSSSDEVVLSVKGAQLRDGADQVSFAVKKGEILGFAGLEGSGVQQVFATLFGLQKAPSGLEIAFQGEKVEHISPQHLIDLKWAYIPAERREQGLMVDWSILRNVSLVIIQRLLSNLKLIKHGDERTVSNKYIQDLSIATDSIDKKVQNLSGGNQQKVVLAKWLATQPEFLILNDPTRGIDVGTKREIYRLINDWAQQGYTILLTSSEIDEVIGLSHRILVFYKGEIIREFESGETDKEEVMRYVLGGEGVPSAEPAYA